MGKHYLSEIGTEFLLDCGVSVADGVTLYIKYKKPDGTTMGTWTASAYSSYSELASAIGTYFLRHILAGTDLDQPGDWLFQAAVINTGGAWYGETVKETIFDAFQ